jgi:hypothetical protein
MTFRSWFFGGLCLALSVAPVMGIASDHGKKHDQPYALIFGTVWGPDDRPVYGMKIKIRRQEDKKARWELYSDHSGEFSQRVPAGKADYVITADLKGYKPQNGPRFHSGGEVQVHVEYDERVDTGLHLK